MNNESREGENMAHALPQGISNTRQDTGPSTNVPSRSMTAERSRNIGAVLSAVDGLLAEGGYAADSSVRHQLSIASSMLAGEFPAVPVVPAPARQIVLAIEAALQRGDSPALILDENSPIRDAIREEFAWAGAY
jgi:hypothetical protein